MRRIAFLVIMTLASCGGGSDGAPMSAEEKSGDNGNNNPPPNNNNNPPPQGDDEEVQEPDPIDPPAAATWLQLSTDDSTSMASAQIYKAGLSGYALFPHEFVNYYDPPRSLFDAEPWAVFETAGELELGAKATPAGEGTVDLLFEMRAPPVDSESRRGWNLFFCVDVSGSMAGDDKIGFVRDALDLAIDHLEPGDRVTLITFDDVYHDVFIDLDAAEHEDEIRDAIAELAPGTATNMKAGLDRTYQLAQQHFDSSMLQRVIVFGDGDANVGDLDIASYESLTRMNNQEGIYLSSVGVGWGFDWGRMDRLADAGKGASVFLPNAQEVTLLFGDYFAKLVEVAADDVSIELLLPEGITLEGFSGEETSTDPEAPVQSVILAAGDDITFIARFTYESEATLERPTQLVVRFQPLGNGEPEEVSFELEHFSDFFAEPGPLLERTRAVHAFGQYAAGLIARVEVEQAISACGTADGGITEINALIQP